MILSLYSAATGMEAQQTNLDTIANNLANVNTTGFKKNKIEFQDMLYQNTKAVGGDAGAGNVRPVGVELGNGTQVVSTAKVFSQGSIVQTGEQYDIAIDGDGFFEIAMPDGTSAYTRNGAFKVGPNGEVLTSDGRTVLSGFGTVPPNALSVYVAQTGEVTINLPGGQTNTFQLQLSRFNNPSGLRAIGDNLFVESDASGPPEVNNPGTDGMGVLRHQWLESSNVNVVQEMVNMITAQRAYEVNSKAIQTSDQMLAQINQLKR